MSVPITLFADGLCEPRNPGGWACWGWVAVGAGGEVLGHGQGCLPGRDPSYTNNRAEYEAILAGLRWVYQAGHKQVIVRSDSQLVINQVTGRYACYAPGLLPLLARIRTAEGLLAITWVWVPREQNAVADHYSREAYRDVTGREPPTRAKKQKQRA